MDWKTKTGSSIVLSCIKDCLFSTGLLYIVCRRCPGKVSCIKHCPFNTGLLYINCRRCPGKIIPFQIIAIDGSEESTSYGLFEVSPGLFSLYSYDITSIGLSFILLRSYDKFLQH